MIARERAVAEKFDGFFFLSVVVFVFVVRFGLINKVLAFVEDLVINSCCVSLTSCCKLKFVELLSVKQTLQRFSFGYLSVILYSVFNFIDAFLSY
jgi:hypothetical protein